MPVQIKRNRFHQSFLFRVIDGACGINEAAGTPVTDFEENQGLALPANEVDLTAAVVDVALKDLHAPAGKVAGCNTFEVISQGFCAIHGE